MAGQSASLPPRPLHPLNAILLSLAFPLFLGALLSDLAYRASFHIQWLNFASWLTAGAVLAGALALIWALVDLLRHWPGRGAGRAVLAVVLLVMCGLGLVSALVHAKDAWGAMPEGLYLSAALTLLACVASWIGFSRGR